MGIPFSIAIGLGNMGESEQSDFRPVPASDCGDEAYTDRGLFGTYTPDEAPFKAPADVKWDVGYGANEADLDRGYCEPLITQDPAYQLNNYKDRYSMPMESDNSLDNNEPMPSDIEFRNRERKSRGFLTRPRIPTERG
jgi:hypothetical protein